MRELEVIWNNAFRYIFGIAGMSTVKPLQCFCHSMPLNFVTDERKLAFYRKPLVHNNAVLIGVTSCSVLGLCHKYLIKDPHCSVSSITRAIWATFACNVHICRSLCCF